MHRIYFVKNVNKYQPIIGENIYDNNGYAFASGTPKKGNPNTQTPPVFPPKNTTETGVFKSRKDGTVSTIKIAGKKSIIKDSNYSIGQKNKNNTEFASASGDCKCNEGGNMPKKIPVITPLKKLVFEKPTPHIGGTTNRYQPFRSENFYADGTDVPQELAAQKFSETLQKAIAAKSIKTPNGIVRLMIETTDANTTTLTPFVVDIVEQKNNTSVVDAKLSALNMIANLGNVESIDISHSNIDEQTDLGKELIKAAIPSEISVGEVLLKEADKKLQTTDFGNKYGKYIVGIVAVAIIYAAIK
jgi:hypothetical protein